MYMNLLGYLLRDFVLYISPFGLVRIRTLHCVYESCGAFVEGFRLVYLIIQCS